MDKYVRQNPDSHRERVLFRTVQISAKQEHSRRIFDSKTYETDVDDVGDISRPFFYLMKDTYT